MLKSLKCEREERGGRGEDRRGERGEGEGDNTVKVCSFATFAIKLLYRDSKGADRALGSGSSNTIALIRSQ